jgi:hypothetical protein
MANYNQPSDSRVELARRENLNRGGHAPVGRSGTGAATGIRESAVHHHPISLGR